MISDDPGPSQIICIIFFLGEIIMKEKREFLGGNLQLSATISEHRRLRDNNVIVKL